MRKARAPLFKTPMIHHFNGIRYPRKGRQCRADALAVLPHARPFCAPRSPCGARSAVGRAELQARRPPCRGARRRPPGGFGCDIFLTFCSVSSQFRWPKGRHPLSRWVPDRNGCTPPPCTRTDGNAWPWCEKIHLHRSPPSGWLGAGDRSKASILQACLARRSPRKPPTKRWGPAAIACLRVSQFQAGNASPA